MHHLLSKLSNYVSLQLQNDYNNLGISLVRSINEIFIKLECKDAHYS